VPTNPLARTYIADRVSPGMTIRRQVEIINTTHARADVAVYAAAASLREGSDSPRAAPRTSSRAGHR
jgi:hypothetical protein